MHKTTLILNSDEETQKAGYDFIQHLKCGDKVFLHGLLGSGKTTFVKGMARALGIKSVVTSPTYTIVRSYDTTHHTIKKLYHLDLYRLEPDVDFKSIGIEELFDDRLGVVIVEWPEKIAIKNPNFDVIFEYTGENMRKITITRVI